MTKEQAVESLINYLRARNIPLKWINSDSNELRVIKQLVYPLNAKRKD